MSLGVLTGVADRLAAFVLGRLLRRHRDPLQAVLARARLSPARPSKGRETMWDFLKNFAVAGGFLLVAFGTTAGDVGAFFADPLSSTHPYSTGAEP